MKKIAAAVPACAGLIAFAAFGCETPSMVALPDGKVATMNEMVDAQKKVKEYVAAMDEYLACVDQELKKAGDDAPDEYKGLMANRHNAAVGEEEAVADAFNEQVRAYKAAHPQPAGQTPSGGGSAK
jgi:hypothetical protein